MNWKTSDELYTQELEKDLIYWKLKVAEKVRGKLRHKNNCYCRDCSRYNELQRNCDYLLKIEPNSIVPECTNFKKLISMNNEKQIILRIKN